MSREMVYEPVPRVTCRSGDNMIAGSNNSLILLGRDRLGPVESGYGSRESAGGGRAAGAIHMVVGRSSEDPEIGGDSATAYISAKTDPDVAAGTTSFGQDARGKSAVILRADCLRVVPRADFKVSVGSAYLLIESSGRIVIEGDVSLGAGAADRIIRGDAFQQFWSTVTVPTPMGPSGPPPPIPDTLLSSRNLVK